MIDIRLIRETPDEVKAKIKKREINLDHVVDEILEVDARRREEMGRLEAKKRSRTRQAKRFRR